MQKAGLNPMSNHPAAGKAGIASRLAIGYHWPGLPEPDRWAALNHQGYETNGSLDSGFGGGLCHLFARHVSYRLPPRLRGRLQERHS